MHGREDTVLKHPYYERWWIDSMPTIPTNLNTIFREIIKPPKFMWSPCSSSAIWWSPLPLCLISSFSKRSYICYFSRISYLFFDIFIHIYNVSRLYSPSLLLIPPTCPLPTFMSFPLLFCSPLNTGVPPIRKLTDLLAWPIGSVTIWAVSPWILWPCHV